MRNHSHSSSRTLARGGGECAPQPGRNPAGARKRRDKAGFEQHAVGLIVCEVLCPADEGKIAEEADGQHGARPDVCHEEQRCHHAHNAERREHVVAGGKPENGRRVPEAERAKTMPHVFEEFACRQNALRSDQAMDLEDKREECGEVDEAEGAQKEPASNQTIRCALLSVRS